MSYLGYEPRRLLVLAGALAEVRAERIGGRGGASAGCAPALDAHRWAVNALTEVGEAIGAIQRGDPLGGYREVCLDPTDLRQWALHRGGAWTTVTDPVAAAADSHSSQAVVNARLVAGQLTPERWAQLLRDEEAARTLLRYLDHLAGAAPARAAFLDTLGAERFGLLLDHAGRRFAATHQRLGPEITAAVTARDLAIGLSRVWAAARADGDRRTAPWDAAALGGHLDGARLALAAAARTPGAASSVELGTWAGGLWQRLLAGFGTAAVAAPVLIGDTILGAVALDGRAARRFLRDLAEAPDPAPLTILLTNGASSPAASGTVLLASTDPSTVRTAEDDDDVRRTMQPILRTVVRLAEEHHVPFPQTDAGGRVVTTGAAVLPVDLGLYAGRFADRLVDPCDGTGASTCPIASAAWPGWHEREAATILRSIAADGAGAAQLMDAATAVFQRTVGELDVSAAEAGSRLQHESFVLAAVGSVVRGQELDRAVADAARFDRVVSGLDLAVGVSAAALSGFAPVAIGAAAWGGMSDAAGAAGVPSAARVLLQPLRPQSVRDAVAGSHGEEQLLAATMKAVVGISALARLDAAGALEGLPARPAIPASVVEQADALAGATRAGDNANAGGYSILASIEQWKAAAGPGAATATLDRVMTSVGDSAAQGGAWVA